MGIAEHMLWGWPLLAALGGTVMAGIIRGYTGFGAALVQAPIYALLFTPAEAVMLVTFMGTLASAQMFPIVRRHVQWPQVAGVTVGAWVCIPLGTLLLISVDAEVMRRAISLIVLVVALVLLSGWRWRGRQTTWSAVAAGGVSGVINGAAGTGGPPVVLYWLSGGNTAEVARANLTTYYAFLNLGTWVALLVAGAVLPTILWNILILMPTFSLALWLGNRLFLLGSDRLYRYLALGFLVALALVTLVLPGRG